MSQGERDIDDEGGTGKSSKDGTSSADQGAVTRTANGDTGKARRERVGRTPETQSVQGALAGTRIRPAGQDQDGGE